MFNLIWQGVVKAALVIGGLVAASSAFVGYRLYQEQHTNETSNKSAVSISPKPTPESSKQGGQVNQVVKTGSIDCVGPDGKQFKTSESECRNLNESWGKELDYIVNCNISSNCGGGTKNLRKSVCDNSTCCEVNGRWVFYEDNNKCNEDQKKNQPNYDLPNYTYPITEYNSPTQAVDNSGYNRDMQSICIGNANSSYQSQEASLSNYYRAQGSGGISSAYENALNQLYNDLQRAITSCKSQYPY